MSATYEKDREIEWTRVPYQSTDRVITIHHDTTSQEVKNVFI